MVSNIISSLGRRLSNGDRGKVLAAIFKGERPNFEQEVLTITHNENTDEIRRLQAESRRLSVEDEQRNHSESIFDEDKRRIGDVLERLLGSRSNGTGNDFRVSLSHKDRKMEETLSSGSHRLMALYSTYRNMVRIQPIGYHGT